MAITTDTGGPYTGLGRITGTGNHRCRGLPVQEDQKFRETMRLQDTGPTDQRSKDQRYRIRRNPLGRTSVMYKEVKEVIDMYRYVRGRG